MKKRFSSIRAKARGLSSKLQALQNSTSYTKVVGLLSGLGFLIAPDVRPSSTVKVDINDAISIGRLAEPRVLEVLPAAVVSFPKSFLHLENSPQIFREIVDALKSGRPGPAFEGISFEKFFEAANRPTKNRKRKIISERRISKTFRFAPETIKALTEQSRKNGSDNTSYLEMLIRRDSV